MDVGGKGGGGKGGGSKGSGRGAAEAGGGGSVAHRRRRRRRRTWPRRAQPAHLQSAGARAPQTPVPVLPSPERGQSGMGHQRAQSPRTHRRSDSSCTRSSPDCHSPPSLSSLDFAPFSLSVSSSETSDDVDLSSPDVACSWQAAPSALGPAPLEEAPGSAGWSAPRGRTGRGGDGALGSIVVSKILALCGHLPPEMLLKNYKKTPNLSMPRRL